MCCWIGYDVGHKNKFVPWVKTLKWGLGWSDCFKRLGSGGGSGGIFLACEDFLERFDDSFCPRWWWLLSGYQLAYIDFRISSQWLIELRWLSSAPQWFECEIVSSIIIINPLTARVVGAPQMILQPVFSIFPSSLPSGTCRTPGLSIPWWCLLTSSFIRLVFFPLSLCLARWFWPDLMNGKHDHTTAVCVFLRSSGDATARYYTSHTNEVLPQDTTHLIQRPCYQRGSQCQDSQADDNTSGINTEIKING